MEPFLQKKALTTFHYALKDKAFLFLGKSETAGSFPELFVPYGEKGKIYISKSFPGKYMHVASELHVETLKDKERWITQQR